MLNYLKKDKFLLIGSISIIIAIIMYISRLYVFIEEDIHYIELLLWSLFFALVGVQLIIIGILRIQKEEEKK